MNQPSNLPTFLSRFARRLRLCDGWLLAQRSLWLACLLMVLVQVTGRLWPVERLWLWTMAPLVAWLALVAAISLLRPLRPGQVALRVDLELELKERLSTALFLADSQAGQPSSLPAFHPALVTRQQRDALAAAQTISPRRDFPLQFARRSLAIAAALLLVAGVLAFLPNPMDEVLAERAAVAQAAEEQAQQIDTLRDEIEKTQELSPEDREELLRQLDELVEQLRANPGDREEALADLSRFEDALRQKLDPNASAQQAALDALAAQLQALTGSQSSQEAALSEAAQALEELAQQLGQMDAAEQEALAQTLAQMAAQAALAGDTSLAQALATLAQAAQAGDPAAAAQAAQAAGEALAQAQRNQAGQATLRQALTQTQQSRQALAQAGTGQRQGQGQAQGQGQGQGQEQGQGQGQGQGQSQRAGSGGGTKAGALPPAQRTGKAGNPRGDGPSGEQGELDQQVYVPRERRPGSGEEVTITGQDSGQGETQVREQKEPLPGAPGQALVPYHEVYYSYLDAASQAMERSYIPPGLESLVHDYFYKLEP